MTKEELAARLNGREYGNEITEAEEADAKAAGLVVLFGYSDDNAELRGAINDEVGCYGGDDILIVDGQAWDYNVCDEPCAHAEAANDSAEQRGISIAALWCKEGDYSWTYQTPIPHATFEIVEDGEPYCRGIVFDLPK